jgi:hypothetical protein
VAGFDEIGIYRVTFGESGAGEARMGVGEYVR